MRYPSAFRRYVATLVDTAAVWTLFFASVRLGATSGSETAGVLVGFAAVIAYEPLATAFGCTLGQALMRFRVRTVEGLTRIGVAQAYGRFVVKYLLGIISFATIPARSDRRAMHDLASETIVVEAASNVG
jgi:uncharacterized RDD family membrane protein YckC